MSLSPIYERWEEEILQRGRREGRQEGRQEERQELLSRVVPTLLRSGLTIEQIAEQLQVDVSEIQRVLELRSSNENQS